MTNTSPYVDIKTLSGYLQIKVSTLYAWSSRNKIPSIKIHGVIRFRMDEINSWLDAFQKKTETSAINIKEGKVDIDSMIASVKREVYSHSRGETRPESA